MWENELELAWVDVRDDRVCPTCKERAHEPEKTLEKWGATPGDGQSECGPNCRCIFVPKSILALYPALEEKNVSFLKGKNIELTEKIPLGKYTVVSDLTVEYEELTLRKYGIDFNLPKAFYEEIEGVDNRIEYLQGLIRRINAGKLTDADVKSILRSNPTVTIEMLREGGK